VMFSSVQRKCISNGNQQQSPAAGIPLFRVYGATFGRV
jgi:hypothetical protein